MKITAIIPDKIVSDVRDLTQSKNFTESLIKALSEWISFQKIKRMNLEIKKRPLGFNDNFSANSVRDLNRR